MAERTLKAAASSEAALAAHEADVAQFHENGLVPRNDLLKARVARADALQQRHRAEAGIRAVRSALCLPAGKGILDATLKSPTSPHSKPLSPALNAQVEQALEARPEVAVLKQSHPIQAK